MVLQVRAPPRMSLSRLIEARFKDWGCKTFPNYVKWLSVAKASQLLNIPPEKILKYASTSQTVHGLLFNKDAFILHPESVYKLVARRERTQLTLQLKRNLSEVSDGITEPTTNR